MPSTNLAWHLVPTGRHHPSAMYASGEDVGLVPGRVDAAFGPKATIHDGTLMGNTIQVRLLDGRYLWLPLSSICKDQSPDASWRFHAVRGALVLPYLKNKRKLLLLRAARVEELDDRRDTTYDGKYAESALNWVSAR